MFAPDVTLVGMSSAFLGHTAAFASRFRGQSTVLGEASRLGCHPPSPLSACLGGELPILGKASFLVGDVGAAFSRDLPLFGAVHPGKPAGGSAFLTDAFSGHDITPGWAITAFTQLNS
jgi:hypothetical protein